MRDFTVSQHGTVGFEGVLFADGTVVVHSMPPLYLTMIFPSWDQARVAFPDEDNEIVWLNDLTHGYQAT
jgi:hypothetical protein